MVCIRKRLARLCNDKIVRMEDIPKILRELEKDVGLHDKELDILLFTLTSPLGLLWFVLKPAITGKALSGAKEFTKRTLLARCITDLITGIFLAKHHHFVQSLTVARPIIESLNLVELTEKDPVYVDHWIKSEWQKITPSRVRKKLDLEEDEFYSYLSNVASHPMWGMTHGMVALSKEENKKTVHISIGPFTDDPLSINQLIFTFGCLLILLADITSISSKHYFRSTTAESIYKLITQTFLLFETRYITNQHLGKHKIFVAKFNTTKNRLLKELKD